jgi:hypothetical protein
MSAPTLFGGLPEASSAVISDDGMYRYLLMRRLAPGGRVMTFLMLNPSTADASVDDPTIRRCKAFAVREGAAILYVVNLFALRATNPRELVAHVDPIGPRNDEFLRLHGMATTTLVAAWGNGGSLHGRGEEVTVMLAEAGVRLMCLGQTRSGEPRHPLYVKADAPLVTYAAVIPS